MTRSIMAYAVLTSFVAGSATVPAKAQGPDIEAAVANMILLTLCKKNAEQEMGIAIELIGRNGRIGVIMPAPAPHAGKFDTCVIYEDGHLTDSKGRPPIPGRPACRAAELIKSCMAAPPEPKAGS